MIKVEPDKVIKRVGNFVVVENPKDGENFAKVKNGLGTVVFSGKTSDCFLFLNKIKA